jgi:transcriptional regulator
MSTIDERLERLVAITEYNVQQISDLRSTTEAHSDQIAENARQIVENTRQISDLRSSVASLVQIAARQGETLDVHRQTLEVYRQNFEAVIARIDQNSAEIRGLQTENRRILDHLFGQQSN